MALELDPRLIDAGRRGDVVVMAGAGISAPKPAALPGWKAINRAIVRALCARLDTLVPHLDTTRRLAPIIDQARETDRFPPDYQAQVLDEMAGERYFQGLGSLHVDRRAVTRVHDGIAALVQTGAVRAVVTTNFDPLIEHALSDHGIDHRVAFDDNRYEAVDLALATHQRESMPVIKIHGCSSHPPSMIDTLKQRRRGRSYSVLGCLRELYQSHWLYLGFSATDLESDDSYLGLVEGAARSHGATYVSWPPDPSLTPGARILRAGYGDRWSNPACESDEYLDALCRSLGHAGVAPIGEHRPLGAEQFEEKIARWANALDGSAAGLCLAALTEAAGRGEAALDLLEKLVTDGLAGEEHSDDFRALQLHYGRLGAAWGSRLNSSEPAAPGEAIRAPATRSLLTLEGTPEAFAARGWLATVHLWEGDNANAMRIAMEIAKGYGKQEFPGPQPRSDEEVVDAGVSASQVFLVNEHLDLLSVVSAFAMLMAHTARVAGDAVRAARVGAIQLLAKAESGEDIVACDAEYEDDFKVARRVGDGLALGLRQQALARSAMNDGMRATDPEAGGRQALMHLAESRTLLDAQGMAAWAPFALSQTAAAHAFCNEAAAADGWMRAARASLKRFPIWESHVCEAQYMVFGLRKDPSTWTAHLQAVRAAREWGLVARHARLLAAIEPHLNTQPQAVFWTKPPWSA